MQTLPSHPVKPSDISRTAAPMALLQMMTGAWISQAIYASATLGIADLIHNTPKSIDELALATNTHVPYLYRLLRALASVGIFAEVEPGQFALTEMAEYLKEDCPNSLRALSMMLGDEWHWHSWGDIVQTVKTGKPALQRLYKCDNHFEYFAQNSKSGDIFNHGMTNASNNLLTAVVDAYEFSSITKLVDIGGGHGILLASILAANPHMQGVLFDLPSVVFKAQELLEEKGVANRCEIFGGNFFQAVPSDGNAYILSHTLLDWQDGDCIQILRNIRQGIAPNGKLLIVEGVIPSGNEPHFSKLLDLDMLIMSVGGRERTKAEFSHLFEAAGFRLNRILPTASYVSVIEGVCI
jgi:hypothetical protein